MRQKWRDVFDGVLDWRELTPAQHRKVLHSMRRNVIEAVDLLDEIFEKIPNMTADPGHQFAMLFEENPMCVLAIHKKLEIKINSLRAKKRATTKNLEEMCGILDIPVMGARLFGDDDYVAEVEAKIQRKLGTPNKEARRKIAERVKRNLC
ncbi:MAG: hypothetical protein NWE89_12075 [Candidatus Bathyarchaeota archaeon]|nr:hypothetical protein [Candidatus Bathyarchaeota archaeon]